MPKRMRLPNGFGQISKLKTKRLRNPYRAMVTDHWNENGKPVRKTVGYFKTYNEAYEALIEYHKNPADEMSDITMKELYEKWSERHFRTIVNSNIYSSAWKYAKSLYNMKVKDVRAVNIKLVLESEMPPSTKKNLKHVLSMMFDYAIEYDIVEKNYARITSVDVSFDSEHHDRLPDELITKIENMIDDGDVYAEMIYVLCYTGMRPSELCGVLTENINMDDLTITCGMKTEAGRDRVVPIHKKIKELIKSRMAVSGKKLYDVSYFTLRYHKGDIIGDHDLHDCRVTFISRMKDAGADEYAIKRIVGHKITDLTEDVYTKRPISWLHQEIAKLP